MSSSNNTLDGMRERLFSMLESEGITQKEFSERLGVSNQTITDWKKGKSRTFTQKLPLIASILHCDLNWLVDGSGTSKPKNADEAFDRLLDIAHESRFIKYDGTHISSTPVGEEKKPAAEDGSEREKEFVQLFQKLTPEQQDMILAQLKGVVDSQGN